MSKYPVQYQSASKGAVDLETMPTPHLSNALKKMLARYDVVPTPEDRELLACMVEELASRIKPLSPPAGLDTEGL
jgi:hypothetical protein